MKYDAGTIVTIVFILLFYFRLIIIQRQRIKKAKYQYSAVEKKNSKKKKDTSTKKPEVKYTRLGIHIRNWWLVGSAIALITFGAVMSATGFLGASLTNLWWIPVNVGIVIFAIGVN